MCLQTTSLAQMEDEELFLYRPHLVTGQPLWIGINPRPSVLASLHFSICGHLLIRLTKCWQKIIRSLVRKFGRKGIYRGCEYAMNMEVRTISAILIHQSFVGKIAVMPENPVDALIRNYFGSFIRNDMDIGLNQWSQFW